MCTVQILSSTAKTKCFSRAKAQGFRRSLTYGRNLAMKAVRVRAVKPGCGIS